MLASSYALALPVKYVQLGPLTVVLARLLNVVCIFCVVFFYSFTACFLLHLIVDY